MLASHVSVLYVACARYASVFFVYEECEEGKWQRIDGLPVDSETILAVNGACVVLSFVLFYLGILIWVFAQILSKLDLP